MLPLNSVPNRVGALTLRLVPFLENSCRYFNFKEIHLYTEIIMKIFGYHCNVQMIKLVFPVSKSDSSRIDSGVIKKKVYTPNGNKSNKIRK